MDGREAVVIDPEIKGDVEEARGRVVAWWEGEDIGRPAMLVRAHREGLLEAEARGGVPAEW